MREKSELYWKMLQEFFAFKKKRKKVKRDKPQDLDEEYAPYDQDIEGGIKW